MRGRGWTRRAFLKTVGACGAAAVSPVTPELFHRPAASVRVFRIGFIAPSAGLLAEVGQAASLGAELGAAEAARLAALFDKRFEVVQARAAGPDAAQREARRLIEEQGVFAIVGGFDRASCIALGELTGRHDVLFFNVGCADDALRGERCRRTTFSVGASTAMYVDALAGWLIGEAGLRRWHFVTQADGAWHAVYRRARHALLEQGGEELGNAVVRPGTLDHRPLLERLRQARPDLVFLSLAGASQAAFLSQYNGLGPSFEVAGPSLSTVQLWSASPRERAGIWPTLWHHKLFRYGAEQLNHRFRDRSNRPLEAWGWASWIAVKILAETVLRAGTVDASELVQFLERDSAQFDGHKGKRLSFRSWDHQLRQPLYLVRAKTGAGGAGGAEDGWDVFESVAELPLGRSSSRQTSRDLLDQLGDLQTEASCRFAAR